jgi:ACS family hexuronate transporter-like MFS transporter
MRIMPESFSNLVQAPGTPNPAVEDVALQVRAGGNFRWVICALLFFATTINYMDRQVLGLLAPLLQKTFGWSEIQYGNIVQMFFYSYALGLLLVGRFIDRVGTRIGYAISIAVWSLSAMGHSLATSIFEFGAARFMLGLGESGNFPAAIKTVTEWFPRKERALATGIFNSGSNIGALVAPLAVPWIAVHLGWRWAFVFTGFFSATWLVLWLLLYRRPQEQPRLSPSELRYIQSGPLEPETRIPWLSLLPHRQTWAFVLGKSMTDPIWWFYLFWLPKFLHETHGVTLSGLGPPLVAIYLAADFGSIGGGWLSSSFLKHGWSVNRARKSAMLICALCVLPVLFVSRVQGLWPAVAIIALAASAHQGWSCNMFTLASDMFPRRAIASVVGIGGFGGAVGGFCIAWLVSHLLQWTHSYSVVLFMAGSAYLFALLGVQLLAPRLEPAHIDPIGVSE